MRFSPRSQKIAFFGFFPFCRDKCHLFCIIASLFWDAALLPDERIIHDTDKSDESMAGGNRGNLNSTLSGVYLRMVGFYERADRGRTNQNTNTNYFLHGAGFFCSSHGVDCRQMAKKTGPRKVAIAGGLVWAWVICWQDFQEPTIIQVFGEFFWASGCWAVRVSDWAMSVPLWHWLSGFPIKKNDYGPCRSWFWFWRVNLDQIDHWL